MSFSKFLFALLLFTSCKNSTSSLLMNKAVVSDTLNPTNSFEKVNHTLYDTSGFFSNCENIFNGSFSGSLQGIDASKDSISNFYFSECYDCQETFAVIFAYGNVHNRSAINHDALSAIFKKGCENNFKDFECFIFLYSMRNPDKQRDVHAINIDFPIIVRIYERTKGDNWKFITKTKVRSFKELALAEFKTIYHLK